MGSSKFILLMYPFLQRFIIQLRYTDIKNKWLNNRQYFYFSYENYDLEYTLHDKSLHDGDTCLNYDKLTSSYGECIEDKWKEISLGSYGCLPPWFHHKEISFI